MERAGSSHTDPKTCANSQSLDSTALNRFDCKQTSIGDLAVYACGTHLMLSLDGGKGRMSPATSTSTSTSSGLVGLRRFLGVDTSLPQADAEGASWSLAWTA